MAISQADFLNALKQYRKALIYTTPDPKSGQKVGLELEKEAMLKYGAHFAMNLVLCVQCDECAYPEPCRFGIDISKTVAPLGFKMELDPEGKLLPSWYGMVLLD